MSMKDVLMNDDNLKERLGEPDATGGSTSAGTVNAKLNKVLENTSYNSSASSTGTATQQLKYIQDTLIGAANATGGSSSAGSIRAKQNKIIGDIGTLNTNVTQMGSNILSPLYNNVGATNDAVGTKTTGSVFAKLNKIINDIAYNSTASTSGTIGQQITYLKNTILGTKTDTGGTATAGSIMAKLNAILSGGVPIVRHIQTGVVTWNDIYSTGITLSGFSNKSKMVAFVQPDFVLHSSTIRYSLYPQFSTAAKLNIYADRAPGAGADFLVNYTVIEFY